MAGTRSLAGITKWFERPEWHDAFEACLEHHVAAACESADVAIDELPDVIGVDRFNVLWACCVEDFLANELDGGRNVADDYLKRRGWKESPGNKAFITALRRSVMSVYEVSEIVPGESMLARDLVRGGQPVRVSERTATQMVKPWDRLAARVLQIGSRTEMAGGALLLVRPVSEAILESLHRAAKRARAEAKKLARELGRDANDPTLAEMLSDSAVLRGSAFLITNIWLDHLLHLVLNPTLPELRNTDGEEIVFTQVFYPLEAGASADAIGRALAAIPAIQRDDDNAWTWFAPDDRASATTTPENQTFMPGLADNTVLGNVELKNNTLVLEVNSNERADRGRALIEPILGGLVAEPRVEARTVGEMMAAARSDEPTPSPSRFTADEQRTITHAYLDQHYNRQLEEPVPMLGDIAPLEAAKTERGRKKLVEWLKVLENSAAVLKPGDPTAGYDFGWMWERLGVADRRR
jgi:hypothetical protein